MKHCLIAIFCVLLCNTATAQELKLGGTEWPPYMGSQIEKNGIAAQIVTHILSKAGYQAKFLFYPWSRTQLYVKTKALDGLGIAWFTKERARTMVYSKPYINTAIVLVKRKADPFVYRNIQDLEGKTMGVILGYGYLKKIESDKIIKEFVASFRQNLMKLVNNRIDLTIEEKLNAQTIMATMPPEIQAQLTIIEKPFEVKPLHITLSKSMSNHTDIIASFNRELANMLEDGSYETLLNSFIFPPLHCCNKNGYE